MTKGKCALISVAAASTHAVAAAFIEGYRVALVALPLSAFEAIRESITGNRAQAEYFGARVAEKVPYGIVVESVVILVIGLVFCSRRKA